MFFDENLIIEKICEKLDQMIDVNEKIAIAVSGGVDSLFLAFILANYYKINFDISNIFCVIVDHDLRPNSKSDALFAKSMIKKFGINNSEIIKWKHEKITAGIEQKARDARYEIFSEFCEKNGIKKIFLGQHLDDNIETFLMNSFRKSGILGLGGMIEKVEKGNMIVMRPLLDLPKAKILKFMLDNKISWVEDETNKDTAFTRNKFRSLIANLNLNGQDYSKINGTISAIQDVNSMIFSEIDEFIATNGEIKSLPANEISLNRAGFLGLHKVKQLYTIYKICNTLAINDKPRAEQIEDFCFILKSLKGDESRNIHFAGLRVAIHRLEIVFTK